MRVIESLNPLGASQDVFFSITDDMLASTSVVEEAPAVYNSGTTYAASAEVSVAGANNSFEVYRSLQAGNLGHDPTSSPAWWAHLGSTHGAYSGAATYALGDIVIDLAAHLEYASLTAGNSGNALSDATKWRLIGPSNAWRMYDLKRNQVTTAPSPMVVEIAPGRRVDSIGAVGLTADSVKIEVIVDGVILFEATESLSTRQTLSWYQYFFGEFTYRDRFARFDLPPHSNAKVRLTLTRETGLVSCGRVVTNMHVHLGQVRWNPSDDALNFSKVDRAFDGSSVLIPRRSTPRTSCTIICAKENVRTARALRERLPATPAFWSGLDDASDGYYDSVSQLGFYTRFTINAEHPKLAEIDLEIEEA